MTSTFSIAVSNGLAELPDQCTYCGTTATHQWGDMNLCFPHYTVVEQVNE